MLGNLWKSKVQGTWAAGACVHRKASTNSPKGPVQDGSQELVSACIIRGGPAQFCSWKQCAGQSSVGSELLRLPSKQCVKMSRRKPSNKPRPSPQRLAMRASKRRVTWGLVITRSMSKRGAQHKICFNNPSQGMAWEKKRPTVEGKPTVASRADFGGVARSVFTGLAGKDS